MRAAVLGVKTSGSGLAIPQARACVVADLPAARQSALRPQRRQHPGGIAIATTDGAAALVAIELEAPQRLAVHLALDFGGQP